MTGTAFVAPTAIKTAAYTALAGDLVPVDTTGGAVTITLPSPATDEAVVAVKLVKGSNNVTVACGGTDTFNDSGTGTLTISTLNQALVMQYADPVGIWYVISGDVAGGGGGSFLPLAGGTMTGWLAPAVVTLTDASTITPSAAAGNVFTLTTTSGVGASRTIANPSSPVNGQHIIFEITQAASGGPYTVSWGTAFLFGAGGPPALSTTANAVDLLGFIYSTAASGWLYAGSGAGAYKPYQFPVAAYGAKGDGKVANDVQTTSGSAVITSATIWADTNCAGKSIMINGANGSSAAPLVTTILSRGSSNQVTLNTTAGATISTSPLGQAFWSSDDTSAINSAVTAAAAYAQSDGYFAEVVFDDKFYGLHSGPTTGTSPQFNTQIPLPYPNVNGSTQKLVIKFTGAGVNNHFQYWESTIPNLAGTCLVSTLKPSHTVSPSGNFQSVIGGPTGGGAFTGGFANTKVVIDGICVVSPVITEGYAYDFRFVACADVYRSSAQVFASVLGNAPALGTSLLTNATFQAANGVGLAMPLITNNADCDIDSFVVEGYSLGYKASDTFNGRRVGAFYCAVGLLANLEGTGGSLAGTIAVLDLIIGQGNYAVSSGSSGQGVLPVYLNLTTEGIGTDHLYDPDSQLFGVIHWNDTTTTTPVINGGKNVKFINDRIPLGYWNPTQPSGSYPVPPAVAASGTATTVYRDSFVGVAASGATVTAVTVDGQQQLSGPGNALVPAGKPVSITYSGGTPAWTWWNF